MVLYTGRQDNMERWPSGRRRTTGNRVTLNRVPGFKSLSLRHKKGIPPQSRWDTFFIVKVHHLNPRMSGALQRDMLVCAGCPNSLRALWRKHGFVNPCLSAKKFHRNRDGIFLSKQQAWHIITRQRAYHQQRQKIILPLLYIITHTRVLRISLRLDDIQGFAFWIYCSFCLLFFFAGLLNSLPRSSLGTRTSVMNIRPTTTGKT